MKRRFVVAVCGASGAIYGIRLLSALLARPFAVHLVISGAGRQVLAHETAYAGEEFAAFLKASGVPFHPDAILTESAPNDFFAGPASGSFRHDGMVIAPCSMGTLGHIVSGTAGNLIHRAADVCLKERRPLVLMPRETPLSRIHLANMLAASEAGATLIPCTPSFYSAPKTITALVDTVVARVLDQLAIPQDLAPEWGVAPRV